MTQLEQLLSLGAQPVGNQLIWKGKVLAHLMAQRNVLLTPEGEAALQIVDVEVRDIEPQRKPAKRARKPVEPEQLELPFAEYMDVHPDAPDA